MKDVTDKLETLILMALDANHGHTVPGTLRREKSTGRVLELHDQGELLAIDEMRPASAYTLGGRGTKPQTPKDSGATTDAPAKTGTLGGAPRCATAAWHRKAGSASACATNGVTTMNTMLDDKQKAAMDGAIEPSRHKGALL